MFMLSAAVRANQPGKAAAGDSEGLRCRIVRFTQHFAGRIIDASVALLAVKAGGGAVHYRHVPCLWNNVPLEQFVRLFTTMSTELMLQHQATMVVNNGKV